MVTPTGLPQFNNFNDLEKKWVHNDSVGLFRTLFTRPHFLSPEIPFIDPPDPVLPDQGDRTLQIGQVNVIKVGFGLEC